MRVFSFLLIFSFWACAQSPNLESYDIIVIGEGTGAFSASVAASSKGQRVLHITSLPWIGGMLTAAGVSATDGNHNIAGGLWREFRDSLRARYGGEEKLFTGWVSNTMFEPNVGEEILQNIARRENTLTQALEAKVLRVAKVEGIWRVEYENSEGDILLAEAKILIDGTDLGDIAAHVGVKYDVGFESSEYSAEKNAPGTDATMVQDLTYVAILRVVQGRSAEIIDKPPRYDPSEFQCLCAQFCDEEGAIECSKMLDYGKLPNGKYMLNWPRSGNDFYANDEDLEMYAEELSFEKRAEVIEQAKDKTLRFVYYLQSELGMDSLEIDRSIFPSADGLALLPYYREARRVRGLQRLTLNEIADPYSSDLYKYGIAVGDYPVDHHHREKSDVPEIEFLSVPSYSLPLGALIPADVEGLIVADKAISVSNLANGTTRLQPVILQVGEAAGILAQLAIEHGVEPAEVDIRMVQDELLDRGGYIQPFQDVPYGSESFIPIQKIGATGIMRGTGIPFQWANKTLFYPEKNVENAAEILDRLAKDMEIPIVRFQGRQINYREFKAWLLSNDFDVIENVNEWMSSMGVDDADQIKRRELAVLLDLIFNPFFTTELIYAR